MKRYEYTRTQLMQPMNDPAWRLAYVNGPNDYIWERVTDDEPAPPPASRLTDWIVAAESSAVGLPCTIHHNTAASLVMLWPLNSQRVTVWGGKARVELAGRFAGEYATPDHLRQGLDRLGLEAP